MGLIIVLDLQCPAEAIRTHDPRGGSACARGGWPTPGSVHASQQQQHPRGLPQREMRDHRRVVSGERVSKMTRTYSDPEALTRLLEEEERDLELAAHIGQGLLRTSGSWPGGRTPWRRSCCRPRRPSPSCATSWPSRPPSCRRPPCPRPTEAGAGPAGSARWPSATCVYSVTRRNSLT